MLFSSLSLSSVLILYIYNRMACPAAAVLVGSDITDLRGSGRSGGWEVPGNWGGGGRRVYVIAKSYFCSY